MSSNSNNIKSLQKLTDELLNNALKNIRSGRQNSSVSMEEYFKITGYLLSEAKEYIDGAWGMIASKKWDASLALSRWVLEASMNLWWVAAEKNKVEQHQRNVDLVGEALRCEANLLDGLAEFWPSNAAAFNNQAKKAIRERKSLSVRKLDKLDKRMQSIKPPNKPNWPNLYVLFRICCAAAHPNLKMWERYKQVGTTIVSIRPSGNKDIACWMAVASTLYLVSLSYCLTKLGNARQLNEWWKNKVVPLL
jgi:hypothetical protein